MTLIPPKLQKGQTIGIVSPGSPMIQARLEKGIHYLKQLGYRVKLGQHVKDVYGYLAGTDSDRAHEIEQMFFDPDVQAIFCTRGGYGTPRILELIDFGYIAKNPKILVGYSDITALQLAIFSKTNLITFSGPMVAVEMGMGITLFTESHFWPLITSSSTKGKMSGKDGPLKCLREGIAQGRLLGGNLSMVSSLVGTPLLPDFENTILVIEDVSEEPYRIDRKLMQLKLAGILERINGIILGQFVDCESDSSEPSLSIEQIVNDITADLNIPIVANMPYGHVDVKYTLPLGAQVALNANEGYVEIIDPAVVAE